jgi:hypothetical protein
MEREQIDEFTGLSEQVCDALRHGKHIDFRHFVPICQYLILPAFENSLSWDIVRAVPRTAEAKDRLYRSCWRKDVDSQAMCSPIERFKHPRPYKPTVEVDWVPIDLDRVQHCLATLRTIRVPLTIAQPHSGLDGVRFELSMGTLFCNARIGWWGKLPDEWLELKPVVTHLEQLIQETWVMHKKGDGCHAHGFA